MDDHLSSYEAEEEWLEEDPEGSEGLGHGVAVPPALPAGQGTSRPAATHLLQAVPAVKAMTRMARAPEPWGPARAGRHLEVHQVAPHQGQEGPAHQDHQAQHHAGGEEGGRESLGAGGGREEGGQEAPGQAPDHPHHGLQGAVQELGQVQGGGPTIMVRSPEGLKVAPRRRVKQEMASTSSIEAGEWVELLRSRGRGQGP